jgi:cytosine permease
VVGAFGTLLSAAGILDHFVSFLTTLGVAVPPIAGIMVAEYWIVRSYRDELEATRASGTLPAHAPAWVPAALVVWVAAFLIGKYVEWGIPSLNALIFALVAYVAAGKMGLLGHPESSRATATATAQAVR